MSKQKMMEKIEDDKEATPQVAKKRGEVIDIIEAAKKRAELIKAARTKRIATATARRTMKVIPSGDFVGAKSTLTLRLAKPVEEQERAAAVRDLGGI